MPRFRTPPPKENPPLDEIWSDWGGSPEDDDDVSIQHPLVEQPRAAPASVQELAAEVPKDPMKAAAWGCHAAFLLAQEALLDTSLTPSARRREFFRCIQAAKGLMSDAMRVDTMNKIDEFRRQMEPKKRGRAAAKTQPRTSAPAVAKIIPIRRDG